jgi:hypothetical protein
MDNREQWAYEVLEMSKELKRATPSESLFSKINLQLPNFDQVKVMPMKKLAWAAAAACILIALNIFSFSSSLGELNNKSNSNFAETQILTDFTIYK